MADREEADREEVDRDDVDRGEVALDDVDREEDGPLTPFALEVLSRIHQRERRRRTRNSVLSVGGTAGALALGMALWPWLPADGLGVSRDPHERLMAVREIGSNARPSAEAVDDLVALARDEDSGVSLAAAHYLMNAVGPASAAARVGNGRVGKEGVERFDELRDAMAFEAMLARFGTLPDEELGGAAAGAAMLGIVHPDPNVRGIAWRLVERVVPASLASAEFEAALEQALVRGGTQDRESASALIVHQRRSILYPKIADLARDPDFEARRVSARWLGELQDPRWVATLLPLLDDVDANVRLDGAKALAGLGVARGVEDLVTMAKGDGSVRPWALRALHEMGESRVCDLAANALGDRAPIVLMEACSILGDLRAQPDTARLEALLLHANVHVRVRAAYALSANGGEVDPSPLLSFLDADNPAVRTEAARFLIRLNDESARRAAERLLDDPMVRVREDVRRLLDE